MAAQLCLLLSIPCVYVAQAMQKGRGPRLEAEKWCRGVDVQTIVTAVMSGLLLLLPMGRARPYTGHHWPSFVALRQEGV